jgi:hypothetical protein
MIQGYGTSTTAFLGCCGASITNIFKNLLESFFKHACKKLL